MGVQTSMDICIDRWVLKGFWWPVMWFGLVLLGLGLGF